MTALLLVALWLSSALLLLLRVAVAWDEALGHALSAQIGTALVACVVATLAVALLT